MKVIRWRNVAWMFAALAAIAVACVWGPVLAHQLQLRKQSRVEHLAAAKRLDVAGFWPCETPWNDWEGRFGPVPAVAPDLLISAESAFSAPWRVSLTGNRVKVAESQGRTSVPPMPTQPGQKPIEPLPLRLVEGEAEIDPARAERIKGRFADALENVRGERVYGHDGVAYQVVMNGRCIQTWSPSWSTGAGRLILIGELLALRASRGAAIDAGRSERAIDTLTASFEHGDGSALLAFSGSNELEGYKMNFGPDWQGQPPGPDDRAPR